MPLSLTPLEAAFYSGNRDRHRVTNFGALMVFDGVVDRATFAREVAADLVSVVPRFRQRVVADDGPTGHAWVEDEAYDVDRHVREVGTGEVASLAEALALFSDEHVTRFDEDHPLWMFFVARLPAEGRTAAYLVTNHATSDGVGMIKAVMSLSSPEMRELVEAAAAQEEPVGPRRPILTALRTDPAYRRSAARQVASHLRFAWRVRGVDPTAASTSDHRRLRCATLDRSTARAEAAARHGSTNELFTGLCGAMATRILGLGGSTFAGCIPVNTRTEADGTSGMHYRLTVLDLPVGTDVPDDLSEAIGPAIAAGTRPDQAPIGPFVERVNEHLPPRLSGWALSRFRSFPDTVISNTSIPMPAFSLGGRAVIHVCAFAPSAGVPLSFAITIYDEIMHLGVTFDPEAVPDEAVAGAMREVLGPFGFVIDGDRVAS